MKLGAAILVAVLIINSVQFSRQNANPDAALSTSEDWPEGVQTEQYREEDRDEDKIEEEPVRRTRGKRRRRLRKRQRSHQLDEGEGEVGRDRADVREYQDHNERAYQEDEGVTAEVPRRRPVKRRRRPYRRYQDEDVPVKPLRRRRKGGRRKVRPEGQQQTDDPQETYPTEITTMPTKLTTNVNLIQHEEDKQIENTTTSPRVDEETKNDIVEEGKMLNDAVKTEPEEVTTELPLYGNKIFDRKKLFSNTRKTLPVTSAVIRRLNPNSKNISAESSPTQKLINLEDKESNVYYLRDVTKATIKTNIIPEGYTDQPEMLKSEKLVKERKNNTVSVKQESIENDMPEEEEPNYPKIMPRTYTTKNRTKVQVVTTDKIEEPVQTTTPPENQFMSDASQDLEMKSEFEKMIDNLDLKSLNMSNLNDYILDMLKSKSGKEYLSKILESRNMTVPQLLEHRERGSSQFHLFEMFPKKENNSETSTKQVTASSSTVTTTVRVEHSPKIKFPSEEVMGSFPTFVADEIGNHEQNNINRSNDNSIDSIDENSKEIREPRLFESMPEFTTAAPSLTKINNEPTWRVIPNPKLQPVSIRGNYQEIPITHVLNRPLENSVNDIYIVDERDGHIHKKFGLQSSETTKHKEGGFGTFRKIPVGVKSAIIISGIILAMATFGFLSLLISCRVRQRRSIMRAKQDMMCEHLQNDDFMTSQQSLSPVLTKHQQAYNNQSAHQNPNNRHYYLWRTLRRTFRYE